MILNECLMFWLLLAMSYQIGRMMPTWLFSTRVISVKKPLKKFIPSSADCGSFKTQKENNGETMILAVAGCVAQAEGKEVFARAPFIDMVFGPQTYHRLPEMIAKATRSSGGVLDIDFPIETKFDSLPVSNPTDACSAFLTIQEGCDKFCTFVVVPYTRGAEFSRPAQDVLTDAKRLIGDGVCEITLLGQNVNCYHGTGLNGNEWGLGRLIQELADIEGLARIRYTTSYPADVDDELIAAHRDIPALMPFLHLPVQSGSDRVLKAMNRRHTSSGYQDLVDKLRKARPDLTLSSDFIVGFPARQKTILCKRFNLLRPLVSFRLTHLSIVRAPDTRSGL